MPPEQRTRAPTDTAPLARAKSFWRNWADASASSDPMASALGLNLRLPADTHPRGDVE